MLGPGLKQEGKREPAKVGAQEMKAKERKSTNVNKD
jgi:hypothetical protein